MMKFKWRYLPAILCVTLVVFLLSMSIDTAINIQNGDFKPISFQAPNMQEYSIRHEEEPLPPIKYYGYLKSSQVNDLNHLYVEVFDKNKHLYKIVKLYGVSVPNNTHIKRDISTILGSYTQNDIIIVSRTEHPDQQFDDVSIKIITPNDILIDLAELLTTKGLADVTGDGKHPMAHALLNKGKSYAQEHRLGIWATVPTSSDLKK